MNALYRTELGGVGTLLPDTLGLDWEYFTFDKRLTAHFEDQGNGTHEFIAIVSIMFLYSTLHDLTLGYLKESPVCTLNVANTTAASGARAYATSDIIEKHPTAAGYWKVVGRKDDQIMLSTGEKASSPLSFLAPASNIALDRQIPAL